MLDLKQTVISLASMMSVSGHTRYDEKKLRDFVAPYFDEIRDDGVGNFTFVRRCGQPNAKKILIDTHFDEIGMLVTDVKENGFLTFTNVGGLDTRILQGCDVTVYGKEGKKIYGVITSTPPHLRAKGAGDKLPELTELMIDTGLCDEEARRYIDVGTPVGFAPVYSDLGTSRISGKAFDDKACGACALAAVAATPREELWGDVYLLFSDYEEDGGYMTGARCGAFGVMPDCALVADVNLGRTPDTKKRETVALGAGASITLCPITDRALSKVLANEAENRGIPVQISVSGGGTGTNTNVVSLVGEGIPTVDVGLPLKSMHTYTEVIDLGDAEALRDLIALFITSSAVQAELERSFS